MNIPKDVIFIIDEINKRGFEAMLVGGSVRDMIMGIKPKDWDITTSATPDEVIKIFPRVIETGIEHGTVTVVIDKENYEITTYRIDGKYEDYRRPEEVYFTKNLEEDLMRRDFTMNAIAYHPQVGYIDPFNGRKSIKEKTIIAVGNPDKRFNEDALRMLRAIRFSAQLDFKIEENTFKSIIKNEKLIENVSVERIRDELYKTFSSKYIDNIKYFMECNILNYATLFGEYFNENYDLIKKDLKNFINIYKDFDESEILTIIFQNMDKDILIKNLDHLKLDNKTYRETIILWEYIDYNISDKAYEIKKIISRIGEDLFYKVLKIKIYLNTYISTYIGIYL